MTNGYDFIDEQPKETAFDSEAWKLKKQKDREFAFSKINEMTSKISSNMGEFQNYLDKQSQLDKYSVGNVMLIMAQKPQATKLKDYDSWKESGASVKPNQKSIIILEPTPEYVREDGTKGTAFKTKAVFDISQTFSKEAPKPSAFNERAVLKALVKVSPVPIKAVDELSVTTMGAIYDNKDKVILVKRGLSNDQFFQSISQEIAHAKFDKGSYNRADYGFKAYCTSYMLCDKYGVDTTLFEFKNTPTELKHEDLKQVRGELSKIRDTMQNISDAMRLNMVQEKKAKSHER